MRELEKELRKRGLILREGPTLALEGNFQLVITLKELANSLSDGKVSFLIYQLKATYERVHIVPSLGEALGVMRANPLVVGEFKGQELEELNENLSKSPSTYLFVATCLLPDKFPNFVKLAEVNGEVKVLVLALKWLGFHALLEPEVSRLPFMWPWLAFEGKTVKSFYVKPLMVSKELTL